MKNQFLSLDNMKNIKIQRQMLRKISLLLSLKTNEENKREMKEKSYNALFLYNI